MILQLTPNENKQIIYDLRCHGNPERHQYQTMTLLYFVNQKPASAEKSTETLKKFHDIQKQI